MIRGNDDQRQQAGQSQQWTDHYEAWTIQDWQHQGYQRILTRQESFAIHNASAEPPDTTRANATSIQVGADQHRPSQQDRSLVNLISSSTPLTDTTPQSSLIFPSGLTPWTVQRGAPLPAPHRDPGSPSSERHQADRENSRSPHRFGCFGRHWELVVSVYSPLPEGRVCAELQNTLPPRHLELCRGARRQIADRA